MQISTDFDFRSDSGGRDPDAASPTLRSYHKALWSKSLPSGVTFELVRAPGTYLRHSSQVGDFKLASDTISNSQRANKRIAHMISQIPSAELDEFQALGSTIGARILFPGNRVENLATINVARGFNRLIADRFDLTLECIRLHYMGLPSPLGSNLDRYSEFFGLFETFEGFVDFFLLTDLVRNGRVNFFLPFTGEFLSPLPQSVNEYIRYMTASMNFVAARNRRIAEWTKRL